MRNPSTSAARLAVPAVLLTLLVSSVTVDRPAAAADVAPVLLKDIEVGPGSSSPQRSVRLGDLVVFVTETSAFGGELWVSDGTPGGTTLLKDINPGPDWGDPFNITVIGDRLYFTASDGASGYEPWVSDGTEAGTVLLKDINPGSGDSFPYGFTALGSSVVFAADDGTSGYELWITDGTEVGTVLLKDINPGSGSSDLNWLTTLTTASGDRVLFAADDGTSGTELWITDGTGAGTVLLKDINPGPGSSNLNALTAIGGLVYFSANDGTTNQELWVSDGTESGTRLVKDILVGAGGSNPTGFTEFGGEVFFTAKGELWSTDGTADGTVLVDEINPGVAGADITELTVVGDRLFFSASTSARGKELWVTDGTAAGTAEVKDINPDGFSSSDPQQLTAVGTLLYFTADDGINGRELWVSDGTAAGTAMVADLNPSGGSIAPGGSSLILVGDLLFFAADDGTLGSELWILGVATEEEGESEDEGEDATDGGGGNGDADDALEDEDEGAGEDGAGDGDADQVIGSTVGPTPVLAGGAAPSLMPGKAVWQLADGTFVPLSVTSPSAGQLRYSADGVSVTLTGGAGTSVANGLVVNPAGEVVCEVCLDLATGNVVEVWMFSTPRLVAAHRIGAEPCQTFAIPVGAPLDGGGPVSAGAHTLQLALPTASGMQAVNVGVTVGGPVPASVPAGEGPAVPVWLLALGLLAVAGAGLAARRPVVTG